MRVLMTRSVRCFKVSDVDPDKLVNTLRMIRAGDSVELLDDEQKIYSHRREDVVKFQQKGGEYYFIKSDLPGTYTEATNARVF